MDVFSFIQFHLANNIFYLLFAEIWNSEDHFHYLCAKSTSRDVSIEMFVESFQGYKLPPIAKGGLMIRKSLSKNSQHFSLIVLGKGGLRTPTRSNSGWSTFDASSNNLSNKNIWLKITKNENKFQAYYKSSTDADWSTFGSSQTIDFGDTPFYVGIAVTSNEKDKLATITSKNWNWSSTGSGQSVRVRFPSVSLDFRFYCISFFLL